MITLTMQIYYRGQVFSKWLCNNDRIFLPQQALDQDRMLQLVPENTHALLVLLDEFLFSKCRDHTFWRILRL